MKFALVSLIALVCTPALAGKVTLSWDANPADENVLGYVIYERVNKEYVSLGQVQIHRAVLVDVAVGDHCYAVTALSATGESEFSEEACVRVNTAGLNTQTRLDLEGPVSAVDPLPGVSGFFIELTWNGEDDPGGSGLATYDIYVSANDGPFLPWLVGTELTSSVFAGLPGYEYRFYSVAMDRAGNRGRVPAHAQARTRIQQNTPPSLDPFPHLTARPGELVIFASRAYDLEDSRAKLRFSLKQSDSPGALINPRSGIFFWQPSREEAGRTSRFTIQVTDNGSPNLSSSQTVLVTIGDYLEVGLTEIILAQNSQVQVPVQVYSTLPSWMLVFALETPAGVVRDLLFRGNSSSICQSTVLPGGSAKWVAGIQSCAGQWSGRLKQIGTLELEIDARQSRFIPLNLKEAVAYREDGTLIQSVVARPGRIVVIGEEPLLELRPNQAQGALLRLYGIPGRTYEIEVTSNVADSEDWLPAWQETLNDSVKEIPLPPLPAWPVFFRAHQVSTSSLPVLSYP